VEFNIIFEKKRVDIKKREKDFEQWSTIRAIMKIPCYFIYNNNNFLMLIK